jgi:putative transposase
MARMARVVIPHIPHHVTQRGNRKQRVFFEADDYQQYKTLLARHCNEANVQVLAYCLMPNHVHIVMVPHSEDGLHRSLAETHRRYTRYINFRENWRGYLWQGRFASFPMDEVYLYSAVRYTELNPVRANLCTRAELWPWSSAAAHFEGKDDDLVKVGPMLAQVTDWEGYLSDSDPVDISKELLQHERTGRPLGSEDFLERMEQITGRVLRPQKPGPKISG